MTTHRRKKNCTDPLYNQSNYHPNISLTTEMKPKKVS